jgi:hypothetical protein
MFEAILGDFAKSAGAGENKRIGLQIDGAGWYGPESLTVPDGIRLVFQPSHSAVPKFRLLLRPWDSVAERIVVPFPC